MMQPLTQEGTEIDFIVRNLLLRHGRLGRFYAFF